jgi:hypothetical protein
MDDARVRPANAAAAKYIEENTPWNNHREKNHRVYKIADALSGKDIFPGGSLDPHKKNINCRCTALLYG